MRILISLTLSFVLFIQGALLAQSSDTLEKIKQVEQNLVGTTMVQGDAPYTLQERMVHYHVKGVSIAVIHDYKLQWAKGYGFADEDLKIPVTEQTLFQAASISKSLNAIGVLKLAQEKKIDLYVDINDYLGNGKRTTNMRDAYSIMNNNVLAWKFPYNDSLSKGRKITIANLLSHTGGLSTDGFKGYEKGEDIPDIAQILSSKLRSNSKKTNTMSAPGYKFEYSGVGVLISQLIIMNMVHQPYEKYMYDNVLEPLHMTNSTFSQFIPRDKRSLLAAGYLSDGKQVPGKYHIYPEMASAGLWTNPTDLSKYIIETQLGYEGRSTILNKQWTRTRLTPYIDKESALGAFIVDLDSTKYFTHFGDNVGYKAVYYGSIEDGNGLVVMINSDNDDIIPEIVNSIAKVYQFKGLYHSKVVKALAVTATQIQSYIGNYEIKPGLVLTITRRGDQLYGQVTGQAQHTLFPMAEDKFYLNLADTQIEFVKDDKGEIIKAIVYQNGPHEAMKLK